MTVSLLGTIDERMMIYLLTIAIEILLSFVTPVELFRWFFAAVSSFLAVTTPRCCVRSGSAASPAADQQEQIGSDDVMQLHESISSSWTDETPWTSDWELSEGKKEATPSCTSKDETFSRRPQQRKRRSLPPTLDSDESRRCKPEDRPSTSRRSWPHLLVPTDITGELPAKEDGCQEVHLERKEDDHHVPYPPPPHKRSHSDYVALTCSLRLKSKLIQHRRNSLSHGQLAKERGMEAIIMQERPRRQSAGATTAFTAAATPGLSANQDRNYPLPEQRRHLPPVLPNSPRLLTRNGERGVVGESERISTSTYLKTAGQSGGVIDEHVRDEMTTTTTKSTGPALTVVEFRPKQSRQRRRPPSSSHRRGSSSSSLSPKSRSHQPHSDSRLTEQRHSLRLSAGGRQQIRSDDRILLERLGLLSTGTG